jgi:regulatory protein
LRGRWPRAARLGAPASGEADEAPAAPRAGPSLTSIAIRLLARRDYGRAELAARLRARGGEPAAIEQVLDALVSQGYLSDARFAQAIVAQRAGRYGRRAIAHALKERGIAPDAARTALEGLAVDDELAGATAVWQQRYGVAPRDEREKGRQVRYLMSRGYSMGVALKVLRAAGAAVDDPA